MDRQLKGIIADIASAWQLLTSIPLPFFTPDPARPAGLAVAFYPGVGLALGLLLVGVGWPIYLLLPGSVASAMVLATWVAFTGMLHLDGFMDACDGLLPPRTRSRRLEIMKDSRVGAFSVVGVFFLLLVKFSSLTALPPNLRGPALVTGPVLARWAIVWAMARYPLAQSEGMAVFFGQGLGWKQVGFASLTAVAVTGGLLGLAGGLMLAIAWLTTALLARFATARIGGLNGDIYGTICEAVETVSLITILAIG